MSAFQRTMLPLSQEGSPEPGSPRTVHPLVDAVLDLDEWRLLVSSGANVLLEGPVPQTEALVRLCTPFLTSPIGLWTDAPPAVRPATLLALDVGTMTLEEQRVLMAWMDAAGDGVRVIATTTDALFPLVERDAFLPELYYRLNVLLLDLTRRPAR